MNPLHLTLTTYNIHHGEGLDRRLDLGRTSTVLQDSGADLACLQEVDCHVLRSRRAHQPRDLARRLQMKAVYGPTLCWPLGQRFGNLLLSRLPLASVQTHLLPGSGGEQRGLIEARVDTPAGEIAVFCTHWGLSEEDRAVQARRTFQIVLASGVPALLAGDLNEGPDGPNYALLCQAGLKPLGPPEPTFPAADPAFPIDHVFGTEGWRVREAYTIPSLASDHRPVVVDLTL